MSKTILITGASSFLGKHVIPEFDSFINRYNRPEALEFINTDFNLLIPSSKELNLLNLDSIVEYFKQNRPNIILHMAAKCGGIGANKDNPALFIHDNLKMIVNLFDAIRIINNWQDNSCKNYSIDSPVTHFYGLGSVCGYPKHCPIPFKECDLWNGYPEDTNAGYGNAKRMLLIMQQSFREQFGLKGAHLIPVNMYGEYDHFDPRNSHVIPALIRKFSDAVQYNQPSVEIWGDGTATREFLYAGDCAKAICEVVLKELDIKEPVNLGTGISISIKNLAELIKQLTNYDGDIIFKGDTEMNGQPIRQLDVSRAKELFGFEASVSLKDGLLKTIRWVNRSKLFKYVDRVIMLNNKKALTAIQRQLGYLPEHLEAGYEKNLHELREFARQEVEKVRKDPKSNIFTIKDPENEFNTEVVSIKNVLKEEHEKQSNNSYKTRKIAEQIQSLVSNGTIDPDKVEELKDYGINEKVIEYWKHIREIRDQYEEEARKQITECEKQSNYSYEEESVISKPLIDNLNKVDEYIVLESANSETEEGETIEEQSTDILPNKEVLKKELYSPLNTISSSVKSISSIIYKISKSLLTSKKI